MSTITPTQLVPPAQLTGSDAAYLTVPPNQQAKIGRAIFSNTDTAAHTITVNINTGTSSAANQVINARALAPGETYVSPELAGIVLPATWELRALADTGAKVVIEVSGVLITGS